MSRFGKLVFWPNGVFEPRTFRFAKIGFIVDDMSGYSNLLCRSLSQGKHYFVDPSQIYKETDESIWVNDITMVAVSRNSSGELQSYDDKPASLWADGSKFWYDAGVYHREAAPAVIWSDERAKDYGHKYEYWEHGRKILFE